MDRYNKYLVIKKSDIASFLNDYQKQTLEHLTNIIQNGRLSKGKAPQSYVCVAADWPMYEQVWSMVESFVDGKPNEIEQLTDRIAELEEEKKELQAFLDFDNDRLDQIEDELEDVEYLGPFVEGIKVLKTQLAASQAYAEQLREALEFLSARIVTMGLGGVVERALALPRDTSAFDAYVANQREAAYQEARRAAAQFEAELTRQRDNLLAQVDLAVEALERLACLGNGNKYGNSMGNSIAIGALRAIKESEEQ